MEENTYKFTKLNTPLKYPVRDPETFKILIPAGTKNVEIAYGQSSRTYKNKKTEKIEHQNVYRWNGQLFNV